MMDQVKLQSIIKTFAEYNIKIEAHDMTITAIDGESVSFDAKTYMQDQLIELICRVMANQLIKTVWEKEKK
ncbi:hypothetical protein [Lentilactobacillus hilgardii]|uniref:Uncharacterized protein n=1 Tax=Lentilactobacillus hilgardii (strain ATCC 8290 / DSM 20176 / CCUG 30140 / JCM 1155 / KCTC 3500 / NBRC 15886 / NCIMB 8040 / NRRL B-1843 / 9) TaxID=1423757 RepID=C0XH28_LENH9|nr:hypothetical protein [Lentilactobacillus hilgardii]EEI25343.1 hypothetical protein HMPREF0519_0539 [Lentilactobacillus hilgardii DSM 20176 = ATCC 8290]KRK53906.1 hypothetical protein FD42_GL001484 [Lentilactobacillus hilgardii DSM 20176 = ATCC 8290]MCP9332548.1 hypothetical protein [Lentilactobacillus hilgardii]MCP9349155.1 hypothetical protein [Lentilactobacillus hilgardii]MCP9352023.1 hypothetical protein [Lentilactobacillus hilgardii]